MLVVLDTNILISALLVQTSSPAKLIELWRNGRITLLSAQPQIEELHRVTRYPKIRERLNSAIAGRLINELQNLATIVTDLPVVDMSPDPYDNYLLSISMGGFADYLITGDKIDLLAIKKFEGTAIVSVADFFKQTPNSDYCISQSASNIFQSLWINSVDIYKYEFSFDCYFG
jgi:putative PIN family toxin of toxin-antitoxin system